LVGPAGWRDGGNTRIEIVVFDGFDELDAIAPYEVLRTAQLAIAGNK
jgi:putative intracellular protease/amidase